MRQAAAPITAVGDIAVNIESFARPLTASITCSGFVRSALMRSTSWGDGQLELRFRCRAAPVIRGFTHTHDSSCTSHLSPSAGLSRGERSSYVLATPAIGKVLYGGL